MKEFSHPNRYVIVPVYNEGRIFLNWFPRLEAVAQEMDAVIVVVDDGSRWSEVGSRRLRAISKDNAVIRLRHDVNCGVGAAIGTGLEYVKSRGGGVVMTIDGDGQHEASDLKLLLERFKELKGSAKRSNFSILQFSNAQKGNGVIVNGSRFLKRQSIPWFRRVANKMANVIAFGLSGRWVSDSQSGMKLLSPEVVDSIDLETPGYEWCLDVMREAGHKNYYIIEEPISVLYNSYSLNKGQHFALGLDMVMKLVVRTLSRAHSKS